MSRTSSLLSLVAALAACEAAAAAPARGLVGGRVYEDTPGGRVARPGVSVRLFRDGGDGRADGRDDRLVATRTTALDGGYAFTAPGRGRYWIAVDSRSVSPRRGFTPGFGPAEVWAEQTAGPAGALCADGQGGTRALATPGPCFGGRRGALSDDVSRLALAEHVAGVRAGAEPQATLDFDFSFDVVTHTRDGHDDPRGARSVQGSLRQFLQNAAALAGADAMQFVPAVPANAEDGEARFWTLDAAAALPTLTDADTLLDGRARALDDPERFLDTNPGRLGHDTAVGIARTPLVGPPRPELELRCSAELPACLVVRGAAAATLRNLAVRGGASVVESHGVLRLEDAAVGVSASGRTEPASPIGLAVLERGSAVLQRVYVGGASAHGILVDSPTAAAHLEADQLEVEGAGIALLSDRSLLRHTLVSGSAGAGVAVGADAMASPSAAGNRIEDSTLTGNREGVAIAATAKDAVVSGSVIRSNREAGIVVAAGGGHRVSGNAFGGNGGPDRDLRTTGSVPLVACGEGQPAAPLEPPVLEAADVGASGAARVAGSACPGQRVEIYRARASAPQPAGDDDPEALDLEFLGATETADCGVFVARLRGLGPGDVLRGLALSAAGDVSGFGPPREVQASTAPEAEVETPEGRFVIRLLPELAPAHVRYFLDTARAGAYDGTVFHRIVRETIVVGGDPLSRDATRPEHHGRGGLGVLLAEFSDRCFARGVVAAVRCPSNCDTGGNQFFVCLADRLELKGQYSVFGEVVEGLEVLDRISRTPVDGERPLERLPIRVRLVTP